MGDGSCRSGQRPCCPGRANALAALVTSVETGVIRIARRVLATPGQGRHHRFGHVRDHAERPRSSVVPCAEHPRVYLPSMDGPARRHGCRHASDLVLAVSRPASRATLTSLVERFVRRGVDVVALTGDPGSPFALAATRWSPYRRPPADADPGDMIAMASTLAVGAWGARWPWSPGTSRPHRGRRRRQSPRGWRRSPRQAARRRIGSGGPTMNAASA